MYGSRMSEYLNDQVVRGHKVISHADSGFREKIIHFFKAGFPQAMRKEWRLFIVCTLFFVIPLLGIWMSYQFNPEWTYSLLNQEAREALDQSYGKTGNLSDYRDMQGSNFFMFGHYIRNNIGIDLITVAGGALAGIGSLYILVFNGLQMGAALTYVQHEGDPEKLYTFVSGHAPYELLGMVVAGMAGMRIGLAIIKPGRMSRGRALLESGKSGLPLIVGACLLTFLAAIIEGFWSAENFPAQLKYNVGFAGWGLLLIYFVFAGRGKRAA